MKDAHRIETFLRKYTPEIAAQLQAARAHLTTLVPRGFELVYDNYNALVFGFGPTARATDAVIAVAGYPRWVTLFFLQGRGLIDPDGVLQGSGSRVRSVRLQPPSVLKSRAVRTLLRQALQAQASAFAEAPRLSTVVKSVSSEQRPRTPSRGSSAVTPVKTRGLRAR